MTLQEKIREFAREAFSMPIEEVDEQLGQSLTEREDGIECFLAGCEYAYNVVAKLLEEYKIDEEIK